MNRETIFSPCRRYRYTLWREWDVQSEFAPKIPPRDAIRRAIREPDSYVQFIGLNPSTADETQDDPTVRRCVGFAKRWGYGAMCMTNLFAFRATDPEDMKREARPIDVDCENDVALVRVGAAASLVVACWGTHGSWLNRGRHVSVLFHGRLQCFGRNADGSPKHPLYLRDDARLEPFLDTCLVKPSGF